MKLVKTEEKLQFAMAELVDARLSNQLLFYLNLFTIPPRFSELINLNYSQAFSF